MHIRTLITIGLFGACTLGHALASEELARTKMCMNCHGFGGKIVGPSYRDIAARRAGEPGGEQAMARRIREGSVGEWGNVAMPSQLVDEAEALQIARWVLSLQPVR